MAREKRRFIGENIAVQAQLVRVAVWGEEMPQLSDMNPYNEPEPESEEMQRLREWREKRVLTSMIEQAKRRNRGE